MICFRLWSNACRVDLPHKQLYVLLSNGHVHVWRMHKEKAPTLVAVWDKLTPNQRDHAMCMSFMQGNALDPALAEMQGMTTSLADVFEWLLSPWVKQLG